LVLDAPQTIRYPLHVPTITPNAIAPLEMLLEACYIPEHSLMKVNAIPPLQRAEWEDALDHRAVFWEQITFEWAVDDGQVDLRAVMRIGHRS